MSSRKNTSYPPELRERAIRMVYETIEETGQRHGAIARVARELGIGRESLSHWINQKEIDDGTRVGVTTDDRQRIVEFEREIRELRRANEMAVSTGGRNELCVLLQWCQIAKGLARSTVEASLDAA